MTLKFFPIGSLMWPILVCLWNYKIKSYILIQSLLVPTIKILMNIYNDKKPILLNCWVARVMLVIFHFHANVSINPLSTLTCCWSRWSLHWVSWETTYYITCLFVHFESKHVVIVYVCICLSPSLSHFFSRSGVSINPLSTLTCWSRWSLHWVSWETNIL
jgi:hypothetical protein